MTEDDPGSGAARDGPRGEVLVYALGGGLGHLSRARRVVRALGMADRAVLLTSSPHVDDPRVTGGLPVVRVDPALERDPSAVRALIVARSPATLIVDAFPLGILGELEGLGDARGSADDGTADVGGPGEPVRGAIAGSAAAVGPERDGGRGEPGRRGGPRIVHVARRLRWDAYRRRFADGRIRFARTLVLEPLEPAHEAFLRARSAEVVPFALDPEPLPSRRAGPEPHDRGPGRAAPGPHWLVVHGGPDDEILELVEHARERQRSEGVDVPIVLFAPSRPAGLPVGVAWRDEHPSASFLPSADRLVTAAGWNLMDETRDLAVRHHVVPFERALDDQPWRAARRRERLDATARGAPTAPHGDRGR